MFKNFVKLLQLALMLMLYDAAVRADVVQELFNRIPPTLESTRITELNTNQSTMLDSQILRNVSGFNETSNLELNSNQCPCAMTGPNCNETIANPYCTDGNKKYSNDSEWIKSECKLCYCCPPEYSCSDYFAVGLDVVFLLDQTFGKWDKLIEFTEAMTDSFFNMSKMNSEFGTEPNHVSVVAYNRTSAMTVVPFSNELDIMNSTNFLEQIRINLRKVKRHNGKSNSFLGFEYIFTNILGSPGERANVSNLIIFLTNAKSTENPAPAIRRIKQKQKGTFIYVVTYDCADRTCPAYNDSFLNIAKNESRIFSLADGVTSTVHSVTKTLEDSCNESSAESYVPSTVSSETTVGPFDPTTELSIRPSSEIQSVGTFVVPVPTTAPPNQNAPFIVGISVAGAVVIVAIIAGAIVFYWRSRYRKLRNEKIVQMSSIRAPETDKWELHREELRIDWDQTLGSEPDLSRPTFTGAFGKVFKGTVHKSVKPQGEMVRPDQLLDNRTVAVKMLPEHAGEISKEEFLKEINLMKDLGQHPHVVSIVGAITLSEPIALVVEFCSEGDLHSYLRANSDSLVWENLLSFGWQISDGLLYITQKGFLHRDVAARNVLVHEGKTAKVGDFGLTRFVYDSTSTYMSRGGRLPLKWMALESLQFNEFTTQTDVWSFGVLLFELATKGGAPYPTVQPYEIEEHLRTGNRLSQPEDCPTEFFDLASSCWGENPADRPTFEELRSKLYTMLEKEADSKNYYIDVVQGSDTHL